MSRITDDVRSGIVVGIDSHKDFHVAAAKDSLGRTLGHARFAADATGYEQLHHWALAHGELAGFGIEGAESYGAGLARYLAAHGQTVTEVARPSRQHRARHGKSDPSDAKAAAAILSGDALGTPKSADGLVEAIRMLQTTRASAVRAKTSAVVGLQSLVVTAPDEIREQMIGLTPRRMVRACAQLSPESPPTTPAEAAIAGLGVLARRYEALEAEAKLLGAQIARLVGLACPGLLDLFGVDSRSPRPCWSRWATTVAGSARNGRLPRSAASRPSTPPPAASSATGSTAAATARPTGRCTTLSSCVCARMPRAANTWPAAWPKARQRRRSCAA